MTRTVFMVFHLKPLDYNACSCKNVQEWVTDLDLQIVILFLMHMGSVLDLDSEDHKSTN